ncbi:hypothetical protein MHU86_12614 [Fragilaria crotonensis]|nr:hypothetical protein MHU86_12614 [Fragilaria crotonensis]
MTAGKEAPLSIALTGPHDPDNPTFGFRIEHWADQPSAENLNPSELESHYRRLANADAYRQHGDKVTWNRYLNLGYYAFDDCKEFVHHWSKFDEDPIGCHRMIWYNFMFHVDRKLDISSTLQAWATGISQPYLQTFAPHHLSIDTNVYSWKGLLADQSMDIESATPWQQVTRVRPARERSQSTEKKIASKLTKLTKPTKNPKPVPKPTTAPPSNATSITPQAQRVILQLFQPQHNPSPPLPSQLLSSPWNKNQSDNSTFASDRSEDAKPPATTASVTAPTNDGTHRLTIRWTRKDDFHVLNPNPIAWLTEALTLLQGLFNRTDGVFYRWESKDLTQSRTIDQMTTNDLRDFISPTITSLDTTFQFVFGLRFAFQTNSPSQWRSSASTHRALETHDATIGFSNSTCASGKMVIAGYILLKAPNSTHRIHYMKSLRQQLPPHTPFFDIILHRNTPMEQRIDHLAVRCGEHHVAPLTQILSAHLTSSRTTALFLSRLAFANLTQEQIKRYFLHHEAYIKSLKSIQLPMYLMNFDQVRIETWGTGETTSRTTREWAQSLLSSDNVRCDAVNGGYDEKPYLLVQAEQLAFVQNALRAYKLRLNPLGHREARFRDSLPGLPNVILIDSSTQQTLDFLEGLSSSDIWQSAPDSVRQPATDIPQQTNTQNSQSQQTPRTASPHTGPKLPPPPRPTPPQKSSLRARSTYGTNNNSDDQTASTHSAMTPSQSGTARIHDLESQLRQLHSAIKLDSTATNSRLSEIDTQLSKSMDCHQTTVHSITDLRIQIQQLTGIITNMADRFDNFPPLIPPEFLALGRVPDQEEEPRAETFMDTSGTGIRPQLRRHPLKHPTYHLITLPCPFNLGPLPPQGQDLPAHPSHLHHNKRNRVLCTPTWNNFHSFLAIQPQRKLHRRLTSPIWPQCYQRYALLHY